MAAADLSDGYIADRFLPDKAIDWSMRPQTACAWSSTACRSRSTPPRVQLTQLQIEAGAHEETDDASRRASGGPAPGAEVRGKSSACKRPAGSEPGISCVQGSRDSSTRPESERGARDAQRRSRVVRQAFSVVLVAAADSGFRGALRAQKATGRRGLNEPGDTLMRWR